MGVPKRGPEELGGVKKWSKSGQKVVKKGSKSGFGGSRGGSRRQS